MSRVPAWLALALAELGTAELAGSRHNPRILEYHACTTLKATQDEVPWCSAFACWAMEGGELGRAIRSTRSAAARSWMQWGVELKQPRLGCLAVFSRSSNPAFGHVAFYLDGYGGMLDILGGNQSNRVCIAKYGTGRLLGYRWPVGA